MNSNKKMSRILNCLLLKFILVSFISGEEEYEIDDVDFMRAVVKYGSDAIELAHMLDNFNFYGE